MFSQGRYWLITAGINSCPQEAVDKGRMIAPVSGRLAWMSFYWVGRL